MSLNHIAVSRNAETLSLDDELPSANKDWLHACDFCSQRSRAFCAAVPTSGLEDLAASREKITKSSRETLFEQGEHAAYAFIITGGYAKIFSLLPDGRCAVHGFAAPGDLLGLAFNGTYAYYASALTPISACRFKIDKIESLSERYRDVARRLLSSTSDELVAAQNQVVMLGRKTALGKVAHFLVMMRDKSIAAGGAGDRIFLPMSRVDIADYLGLTTETVSRTLSALETDGVISKVGRREIACKQADLLVELSESG